jgi:hypothetical protein
MKGVFSSLSGSKEAITRLQESPVHYYQRSSAAAYLGVDYARTSLSGTGGYLKVGRKGNAKWTFAETFGWSSPGFDLNDIGYLKQADALSAETELMFRQTTVWKLFRSNTLTLTQLNQWDYGRHPTLNTLALSWKTMLLNRFEWTLSESYGWNFTDTRKMRGGPDLHYDPYFHTTLAFNTDKSRPLVFLFNYVNDYNLNKINRTNTLTPSLTFRMGKHIHLTGEFTYTHNIDNTQYVSTIIPLSWSSYYDPSIAPIYLAGYMEQQTYALTMKLQANLTPDVSLQFYASPFTSTARYSDFKRIALDGSYTAEDNPSRYAMFSQPDFNFNEFRSNLVARWEYRPGSTLYFVWEHRLSNREKGYLPGWNDNLDRMFALPSTNTFMIKFNYWFNL